MTQLFTILVGAIGAFICYRWARGRRRNENAELADNIVENEIESSPNPSDEPGGLPPDSDDEEGGQVDSGDGKSGNNTQEFGHNAESEDAVEQEKNTGGNEVEESPDSSTKQDETPDEVGGKSDSTDQGGEEVGKSTLEPEYNTSSEGDTTINNNKPEPSIEPKKLPPNRPGGRIEKEIKPTEPPRGPNKEKVKIICCKKEGVWRLMIEFPSESKWECKQGDIKIDNKGILDNFRETVICHDSDGSGEEIDLAPPLIFRFNKNWQGKGRQTQKGSQRGAYIIIAPENWCRKHKNPPIAPEPCTDESYIAHFFPAQDDDEDGFENIGKSFISDRFSLDGKLLDDHSDKGNLYIGVPVLKDTEGWAGISWVKIGSEGGGRWYEDFDPAEKEFESRFTKSLIDKSGWFYIRIYDSDVKRIASFDFRLSHRLDNIFINGKPYNYNFPLIPDEQGHQPILLTFKDSKGNDISAECDGQVMRKKDDDIYQITQNQNADHTKWQLHENGRIIDIDILLPRIWWRIDEGDWKDKPFSLSREDFTDFRRKTLTLLVPVNIDRVYQGFDEDLSQNQIPEYTEDRYHKQIKIDLGVLYYDSEISESCAVQKSYNIRISDSPGGILGTFPVIHILPDLPAPPDPVNLPDSDEVEEMLEKPVSGNKGFSLAELKKAGYIIPENCGKKRNIRMADGKCISIRIDKRRKSAHSDNVNQLRPEGGNDDQ